MNHRNDDMRLMAQAFNNQKQQKPQNGDVLLMSIHMMCTRIDKKTIDQYQCFKKFCKDFENEGGVIECYMTFYQLHSKINSGLHFNGFPKIQFRNKSYVVYGYCDISSYRKILQGKNNLRNKKKRDCYYSLKRFIKMGGAVKIDNSIYVKMNPLPYNAI